MNSLLADLLGLAAGLGACAAAFVAWRSGAKGRQSEWEAAERRRQREQERVKAEATQRAEALAQREIAMSHLARRRDALRQRRDTAESEKPPPAPAATPGPPGKRGRPAADIPPDALGPSIPSGQPLRLLPEQPPVEPPAPPPDVPAPRALDERPEASHTVAGGGAHEAGTSPLAQEASPAADVAVQPAPTAVQTATDTNDADPVQSLPSATVSEAASGATPPVDAPAMPASSSQQPEALLQQAVPEDAAALPPSVEKSAEVSDANEVAEPEEDHIPSPSEACATSYEEIDATALLPSVEMLAEGSDAAEVTATNDDDAPASTETLVAPNDCVDAGLKQSTSGLAEPVPEALSVALEPPSSDAPAGVAGEASNVASSDDGIGPTPAVVDLPPADLAPPSARDVNPPAEDGASLLAPQEPPSGIPGDGEAAPGPAIADVPVSEEEPPLEPDEVFDEAAEEATAATAPVDDLLVPEPSVVDIAGSTTQRTPRTPARRYRPVAQDPSRVRATSPRVPTATPRDRAQAIDLRLNRQLGGGCVLSLVARRNNEIPDQVRVSANHGTIDLTAMQDGWFEDVRPGDLGSTLQTGVQWAYDADDGSTRWLLSGRSVFVLARHQELSGVVNTPRLELGQSHVVVCTQARAGDVRAALTACGAQPASESGEADGLPMPWIAFHGVTPTRPVPASSEGSDLDCLCPHPDARLQLAGGIRLEGTIWLAGFPPRIFVLGDPAAVGDVYIDQKPAQLNSDGSLTAPGWDATGTHLVAGPGSTKSYSIQDPPRTWTPWAQTSAQTPLLHNGQGGRSVCGALVTMYQASGADKRAVLVPSTNTLLIGAEPGQIWVCEGASHLPATAARVGFPPFKPVWAAPQRPLRCDKRNAAVLLLPEGAHTGPAASGASRLRSRRAALKPEERAWCAAILDASRKGLAVSPSDPQATALWKAYRNLARSMTRSAR